MPLASDRKQVSLDEFCARVARYTNAESSWQELDRDGPKDNDWMRLLRAVIKSGHTSVLEHVSFTFEIEGVSRACSHQLVRHRIASYAQKSLRRMRVKELIIPKTVKNSGVDVSHALDLYRELYRAGVPMEDARFFAPMAAAGSILVTMNARVLREVFFPLRLEKNAQWEIRFLANEMLRLVKPLAPVIFENFPVEATAATESG
jgi:thymidylate synthase (FAD)